MPTIAQPATAQPLGPGPHLLRFLTAWLGVWPSPGRFRVAPSARRVTRGWDNQVHPLIGVAADERFGHAVALSVPPLNFGGIREIVDAHARSILVDRQALGALLPATLGLPDRRYIEATLRWTTQPAPLPEVGTWRRSDDPGLPSWLLPFNGAVLVATDRAGRYAAGVGIKQHNRFGHEIAVETNPDSRGRGLARALVAQAARHVLAAGAIPIYIHDLDNTGSAHVAKAAGFPDRGWRWLGLAEQPIAPPYETLATRKR
jgi:GNAT superfamily N-acetyltransferase